MSLFLILKCGFTVKTLSSLALQLYSKDSCSHSVPNLLFFIRSQWEISENTLNGFCKH